MIGQVIKVISNQFYVKVAGETIMCSQRGKLKQKRMLPLVGDHVKINKEDKVIEGIEPRKNMIIRPNVANIDQAFIITSFKTPDFSTNLLDKLLVELELNKIIPIICLTKKDLITTSEFNIYQPIISYYEKIGYKVVYNTELETIKDLLKNKVTVFMGQTGAGKSTLLNKLDHSLSLETGEVSLALGRGRHTTRFIQIIDLFDGQVLDTPGFSALEFNEIKKEYVKDSFIEFENFPCRYKDCTHTNELECNIKKEVMNGNILSSRYENYLKLIANNNYHR